MKNTFLLTIFSAIFLLSCGGKSEDEKGVEELGDFNNEYIKESSSDWGSMENANEYMEGAMENANEYMEGLDMNDAIEMINNLNY